MSIEEFKLLSPGRFDFELRVQSVMLAKGFTGGATAIFADPAENIVSEAGWYPLGGDAKAWPFGSSDRSRHFTGQVAPGVVGRTARINWIFEHRSNRFGAVDQVVSAGKKLGSAARRSGPHPGSARPVGRLARVGPGIERERAANPPRVAAPRHRGR